MCTCGVQQITLILLLVTHSLVVHPIRIASWVSALDWSSLSLEFFFQTKPRLKSTAKVYGRYGRIPVSQFNESSKHALYLFQKFLDANFVTRDEPRFGLIAVPGSRGKYPVLVRFTELSDG